MNLYKPIKKKPLKPSFPSNLNSILATTMW